MSSSSSIGKDVGASALGPALEVAVRRVGLSVQPFAWAYENATTPTMRLCEAVEANCFVNASFDPRRNGTCPASVAEFYLGFERENLLRGFPIAYPFGAAPPSDLD